MACTNPNFDDVKIPQGTLTTSAAKKTDSVGQTVFRRGRDRMGTRLHKHALGVGGNTGRVAVVGL